MSKPEISFFLPSLSGGGAEHITVNLANALAQCGLQVHLILGSACGEFLEAVSADVKVVDLRASRARWCIWSLAQYLRRTQPLSLVTVLEHASVVAWVAKRLSFVHTKLIIAQHSRLDVEECSRGMKAKALRMLIEWVYPQADSLIAVSAGMADEMASALHIPRDRIRVIYNPVVTDEALTMANEELADEFCERAAPLILGVGRLSEPKDFPLLVEAFAALHCHFPSARLLILGEGPERHTIEEYIHSLGLEDCVSIPGFTPNPYVYMKKADCFVLSSRWEVLPTVLIEALMLGTPIVSTDCGAGVREILGEVTGNVVITSRDPRTLAQAIEHTLLYPPESVSGLDRFVASEVARQYAALIPR